MMDDGDGACYATLVATTSCNSLARLRLAIATCVVWPFGRLVACDACACSLAIASACMLLVAEVKNYLNFSKKG